MKRRDFLAAGAASMTWTALPAFAQAQGAYNRLLVLVELKGANDGMNTVVPFADPAYARLRPRIGLRRDEVIMLDEATGLHPSLAPLLEPWRARELAIVQGLGYPNPNLSHFRSIEIWDTASRSEETLTEGWLARAFAERPAPADFAADGVVVGQEMGPLAGGARTVALRDPEQFLRQARMARPVAARGPASLAHLLRVEGDIALAASKLQSGAVPLATPFPQGEFGSAVRAAAQVLSSGAKVAAIRLSLNGFDTHQNQPGVHANLLRQLGEGLMALRSALKELNRWDSTLVMTYAEFGRRAAENASNGTDHGTANAHFLMGGRVVGGLHGSAPRLDRLENGNLPFAVDFRSLYATVLDRWWGQPSREVLRGRFAPLEVLRA